MLLAAASGSEIAKADPVQARIVCCKQLAKFLNAWFEASMLMVWAAILKQNLTLFVKLVMFRQQDSSAMLGGR